jgi:arylsulfatase A-like enzyme
VLAKVKEIGEEENTLIFFLSDNGGPTEQTTSKNDPLRGFKATTLEGGIRIPFCVQWKAKLPAGAVYEHPVMNLDILPTCLAAAGAQPDAPQPPTDGVDLVPYLTGKIKDRPHEIMYWRFGDQWAIRKGDFKLVANRIDGPKNVKLYNLKDDIGESKDLFAAMPEKVKELQADYDKWNAGNIPPLWVPAKKKAKGKD